jgi:MoxR-like ATPase
MLDLTQISQTSGRVIDSIEQVIVGKRHVIELVLTAILCEGHVLIEDVPGIGKTMLAKSVAKSLGCSFRRIQFTPDLLPSDVTGIMFFNQKIADFEFRPGPLQAQIVLADEINRATPRTQSSLLEAMEEKQITVEGETMFLPRPFLVLATQNPIELEGTFPLPEAQLDRFFLKTGLGYPSEDEENAILLRFERENPLDKVTPAVSAAEILQMQKLVRQVRVEESVRQYAVRIVRATRQHPEVQLGVSPRGSLALYKAAQALAAIRGRHYVLPDDFKELVPAVLPHRLITSAQTRLRGRQVEEILAEVVMSVPAPLEYR